MNKGIINSNVNNIYMNKDIVILYKNNDIITKRLLFNKIVKIL